jgi:integral membrane sensor domain MASE1
LTTLPSGLWRFALGIGIPVGFSGELADLYGAPGWITPYVIVLSLLAEGAALLTLGLVRPWGERVPPHWPLIGGRDVPVMAAVIPAATGAVILTFINWTSALMWFGPENNGDPDAPHGFAGFVMAAAYAPMLAWGPLLAAVTTAYLRRRRDEPSRAGRALTADVRG